MPKTSHRSLRWCLRYEDTYLILDTQLKYWGGIPEVCRKTGSELNSGGCTIRVAFTFWSHTLWRRMRYVTEIQKHYKQCYIISRKDIKVTTTSAMRPQGKHNKEKYCSKGYPFKFIACLAEVLVPVSLSVSSYFQISTLKNSVFT